MSSHENISEQEKDVEDDSVTNSMNLDEDENNEEENGNYSSNNNISPFPTNSNPSQKIFPPRNIQKSQPKYPKKQNIILKNQNM